MEPASDQPPIDADRVLTKSEQVAKRRMETKERHRQAVELRRAGYTYDVIAQRLGFSNRSAARQAINNALREFIREPAEEVLTWELDRLDRMLTAWWSLAIGAHPSQAPARLPDAQATDRVLAIMRQRASYLGLNAPEKFDVRALIMQLAEAEGYTDEEKQDAVVFVEHYLKETIAGS